ncbi:AMP-binding protein [Streptomyces griseus]|uniref:AMP-binding protein n=1 Tax=Streptomyces stephensoniae TaxID=3375367 RepID=A0ABU2VZV6_9ACTN|nr:AMP-binding protein [Streptomyces griseus]MDT0490889.1 AMP-binding protein [Streptomyces griseus]
MTAHVTALRPLPDLLREHARRLGTRTAFQDSRSRVTYSELELRTGRLAGHLVNLGLRHGERAAILLGSRVEAVESVLAALMAPTLLVRAGGHGPAPDLTPGSLLVRPRGS